VTFKKKFITTFKINNILKNIKATNLTTACMGGSIAYDGPASGATGTSGISGSTYASCCGTSGCLG